MKLKKIVKISVISILALMLVLLCVILGMLRYLGAGLNNFSGIEKTLKNIYPVDGMSSEVKSDVVSVKISLDRFYSNYKLILDIDLGNNRNIILRDFNGYLKSTDIQKINDYTVGGVFYDENETQEDKKYWTPFEGIGLRAINEASGLKLKTINNILNHFQDIYD
ncbi:MAG: hypothetical protein LBJ31_09650 [Treponema sp.]|jgi:hypothetical protein|nr:hypothetical protein [Treponema sp.]